MTNISTERLEEMLAIEKHNVEHQTSARYKREAEDRVTILTELLAYRSFDKGEAEKPAYWAVHSATGIHIGLWPRVETATEVWQDYPGGKLTPLYASPQPAPKKSPPQTRVRRRHRRTTKDQSNG